ncbi:ferric reductase like transmembrane component [Diplocarpon mali]|nr:ferric reductase like transmembrane component [Diplocarpon mali]
MHLLAPLLLLWQIVGAGAKQGTIGMGISMYKPVCAYACHDALASLYLSCTTFSAEGHDMEGMVMKRMEEMGGEAMGTTSEECYATDPVWAQTLAYCFRDRCAIDGAKEGAVRKAWTALSMTEAAYEDSIPPERPAAELAADAVWLNVTSLVNSELYFSYRQTLSEFEFQEEMHVRLSVVVCALTVGITLLAGLYQHLSAGRLGNLIPFGVSKHLLLPALFNGRHQAPLPGNLGYAPSRILSLFIFLYVVLNLIFSAVPYKSTLPTVANAWFTSEKSEIATYVANRTGVLSFANLALAILFAGRSNPLFWLADISQTTCLTFHRWAARVSTVQAVVHSILYTLTYFWSGGADAYYAEVKVAYYWWGIVATVLMSLGIAFSALPIRLYQYEIFLVSHIVMAIMVLVGCWYHVVLRFKYNWGYEVWLYIAFALWAFDRLSRFLLGIYRDMLGTTTQALAELAPGGKLIKLTVYPGTKWNFGPGQHAFLSFPTTGRLWENHPFSIAAWDHGLAPPTSEGSQTARKEVEKDPEIAAAPVLDDSSGSSSRQTSQTRTRPGQPSRPSVTFLVRPRKGITSSIQRDLSLVRGTPVPLPLSIEGPYGRAANLASAESILCIAGGMGITALMAYVQRFVEARRAGSGALKAARLLLAWSYRQREIAEMVRALLPADAAAVGVECRWTCTGTGTADSAAGAGDGRMDVDALVREEAVGVRRLAVLVCAPGTLADEARRVVVGVVGEGGTRIDLHEESFAWPWQLNLAVPSSVLFSQRELAGITSTVHGERDTRKAQSGVPGSREASESPRAKARGGLGRGPPADHRRTSRGWWTGSRLDLADLCCVTWPVPSLLSPHGD